jgi:hypothetical protein
VVFAMAQYSKKKYDGFRLNNLKTLFSRTDQHHLAEINKGRDNSFIGKSTQ